MENSGTPLHWRERENSWINRLHTRVKGYNTRREIAKPQLPQIPTHGFRIRQVRRSRHKSRVTEITHNGRVFLSWDWQRRMNYFAGLVNNRPHLVDSYISHLAPRNLLRTITYIGQHGIPGNVQKAFNVLRKRYLSSFPTPSVQPVKGPKLIVMGFTSEIANVVPLRGLLMRPNILSRIPPVCVEFRESITLTIPYFKYGLTLDSFFLNASAVARDISRIFSVFAGILDGLSMPYVLLRIVHFVY